MQSQWCFISSSLGGYFWFPLQIKGPNMKRLSQCSDSQIGFPPKETTLSPYVSNHSPFLNVLNYDIESLPAAVVLFWKWHWPLTSDVDKAEKKKNFPTGSNYSIYHNIMARRWNRLNNDLSKNQITAFIMLSMKYKLEKVKNFCLIGCRLCSLRGVTMPN